MELVSWLETLHKDELEKLYRNRWTCQAVFRVLPPLARQYLLRLVFLDALIRKGGHAHSSLLAFRFSLVGNEVVC
jgi:Transcription factor Tfb2